MTYFCYDSYLYLQITLIATSNILISDQEKMNTLLSATPGKNRDFPPPAFSWTFEQKGTYPLEFWETGWKQGIWGQIRVPI